MKKVIERIVEGPGAPNENDLWLNGTTLKKFQNGEWVAISGGDGSGGGSGSASSLSDMTDVDISSPSDGDTLVYNATTHKWESGSGGSCSCLSPMVVEGDLNWEESPVTFTPGEGAPTLAEAQNQMFRGGLVYLMIYNDGETFVISAIFADTSSIGAYFPGEGPIVWEANQTIQVKGSLSADFHDFIPDNDEMSWADAKQALDNGDIILLCDSNRRLTLSVSYYDSEANALITEPHNGSRYSWYGPSPFPVAG